MAPALGAGIILVQIQVSGLIKTHIMKMTQELQTFTIEEFQADFDNLMSRVENGESFIITSEHGNAVMVPYKDVVSICEESNVDFEEIVKIHTDHEEGS
jgi:antitoxin (DNA-binding transcriptional repressor) of toxin-antitoxin stability system